MDIRQLYIDGKWTQGTSEEYIEVENPVTKEVIAWVPRGNETDVNVAVDAANKAFLKWSEIGAEKRAEYLDKIAEYLEKHKEEIGETITKELGAPKKMVMGWHVESAITEARFYAETARNYTYETRKNGVYVERQPIGVVAGLTPWNYPLDQVSVKVLPALAAGNCVILKPSQQAPLTAYHFADAVIASGIPAGVFNLVTGKGGEVGNVLANHLDVQMISFTGSTGAGQEVGKLALRNIKKIALELGGKSAAVLLMDGDIDVAVETTLTKCFMNTGQTCSALTRFIVPRIYKAQLEEKMILKTKEFLVGDPLDEEVDIGPLINKNAFERVATYIEKGLEEGAKMLVGKIPEGCENGYYIEPVIFVDVESQMSIAKEEIFGPVLSVLYYDTEEEALKIANDSIYGLSGAVFGETTEKAKKFAMKMDTGVVHLNGAPFTVEAPFGGYKQSGLGRENSIYSFDEYMEIKALLVEN